MLRSALLVWFLALGAGVSAQVTESGTLVPPPILTLNQERLYSASAFGERVRQQVDKKSSALAAENRLIEAELVAEEQRLTTERLTLDPAAFRELAEDFDIRVTEIRQAQAEKRAALQTEAEEERARFFELAYPVLTEMVRETGALAILNQSAVILSARQIDVTDLAIARVDAAFGAAAPDPLPPTSPTPRPGNQPAPDEDATTEVAE